MQHIYAGLSVLFQSAMILLVGDISFSHCAAIWFSKLFCFTAPYKPQHNRKQRDGDTKIVRFPFQQRSLKEIKKQLSKHSNIWIGLICWLKKNKIVYCFFIQCPILNVSTMRERDKRYQGVKLLYIIKNKAEKKLQ